LIPQLDFVRPSTWSHPVTWERVRYQVIFITPIGGKNSFIMSFRCSKGALIGKKHIATFFLCIFGPSFVLVSWTS
jgi:hypothetical protein